MDSDDDDHLLCSKYTKIGNEKCDNREKYLYKGNEKWELIDEWAILLKRPCPAVPSKRKLSWVEGAEVTFGVLRVCYWHRGIR